MADAVDAWKIPGVTGDANYQLNIEDGATAAEYDVVLFVDASKTAAAPFELQALEPAAEVTFTSHAVSPASVLAVCRDQFGARPVAWLLGIRGYEFEFAEGLSPGAQQNLKETLAFVESLIRSWRNDTMETKRKTILAIDDDPDIRAALRVMLEAAGFSVGEAANGEEGLKAAARIKPDAVIVDLMMENVDSGSYVAKQLKDTGYPGPVYMLSSAGDAVQYNLDARELGLAGIFQKPMNPKTLVAALKAELGAS